MTILDPSQFNCWEIYHLLSVRHMQPPKDKFVVVIDVVGNNFRGLVVSSNYPPFVMQRRTNLKPLYAEILMSEHKFLVRDSLVDCTTIFTFGTGDLAGATPKGSVSTSCAQDIQRAVSLPGFLPTKTCNLITSLPLP